MADFDFTHGWHAWIGKRVCVKDTIHGTLRYFGKIAARDGKWCGIELDESIGENDGVVKGERYFSCSANHGIFVHAGNVTRLNCGNNEGSFSKDFKQNESFKFSKFSTKASILSVENQDANMEFHRNYNRYLAIATNSNQNETFNKDECGMYKKTSTNLISLDKTINFSTIKSDVLGKPCKDSICDQLDYEESLGIIPDVLDCSSQSDFLCLNSNVFLPAEQNYNVTSLLSQVNDDPLPEVFSPVKYSSLFPQAECTDSPLQNRLTEAKYTSTPKQIIKGHYNFLNSTVVLQQNQFCDFLLQDAKLEPVIAGSDHITTEIEFCSDEFGSDQVLCSTSKIFSLFQTAPIMSDKKIYLTNDHSSLTPKNTNRLSQEKNLNITQILSDKHLETNITLKKHVENSLHHVDVLDATFEVKSVYDDEVMSYRNNFKFPLPSTPNCNNAKNDSVSYLDSTSAMCDNTIQNLSCEKTFIVECSTMDKNSTYSKVMPKIESLNITFNGEVNKNYICQNLQVNHVNNQINRVTSNLGEKSLPFNKIQSRKSISLPVGNSQESKDLNTTFCVEKVDVTPKRHSTSTCFGQKKCNQSSISRIISDTTEKLNSFKKPLSIPTKLKNKPELKQDSSSISKSIDTRAQKYISCNKKFSHNSTQLVLNNVATPITLEKSKNQIPVSTSLQDSSKDIPKTKCRTLLPQMGKVKADGKSKLSGSASRNSNAFVKPQVPELKFGNKEANLTKVNKLVDSNIQAKVLKKTPQASALDEYNVSKQSTQDKKENATIQKCIVSKLPSKGIKTREFVKNYQTEILTSSDEFSPNKVINTAGGKNEISRDLHKVQLEEILEDTIPYEYNSVGSNASNSNVNQPPKNVPKIPFFSSNKVNVLKYSTLSKENTNMEYSVKDTFSKPVRNSTRNSLLPSFKPLGLKSEVSTTSKIPNVRKSMCANTHTEITIQDSTTSNECILKTSQQSQFQMASLSEKRKNRLHKSLLQKENVQEKSIPFIEVTESITSPSENAENQSQVSVIKSAADVIVPQPDHDTAHPSRKSKTFIANKILMPISENAKNESRVPTLKSVADTIAPELDQNTAPPISKQKVPQKARPSRKLQSPRSYPRRSRLPVPHD